MHVSTCFKYLEGTNYKRGEFSKQSEAIIRAIAEIDKRGNIAIRGAMRNTPIGDREIGGCRSRSGSISLETILRFVPPMQPMLLSKR